MKKFTAFLLAVFMLLGIYSCAAEEPSEFVYKKETEDPEFMNYEIGIITINGTYFYPEKHIFSDAVKARLAEIEKKQKMTISIIAGEESIEEYVRTSVAAYKYIGDMYFNANGNNASKLCYGGYLIPFTDPDIAEYVDITDYKKYGTPNLYELAMYKNEPYLVFPMYWPEKGTAGNICNIFALNENLLAEYNLTDPREIYEQKQWTTSKLTEITPDYFIQNGDRTIYTFISHQTGFARSFMTCNNIKTLDYSGGTVKSGISSPEALRIVTWASDYVTNYGSYIKLTQDWHPGVDLYNNNCFMALTEPGYVIGEVSQNLENFGLVPFPSGPDAEPGTYGSFIIALPGLAVIATTDTPDACGYVVSELLEPLPGYETEDSCIDYLYENIFFTRKDAELYYHYAENSMYDYWTVGGNSITDFMAVNIGTKSPAALIESAEHRIDDVIEDYIATNYDFMSAYYEQLKNK